MDVVEGGGVGVGLDGVGGGVANEVGATGEGEHVLVVLDRSDELARLSLRNAPQVHLLHADQLNTYDVLVADDVVFTRAALDAFVAHATRSAGAPAGTEEEGA